jgi:calcium-dependent protein kinase
MGCSGTKEQIKKQDSKVKNRRMVVISNISDFETDYKIKEKLFEKESEKIFLVQHLPSGENRIMRSIKKKIIKDINEIDQMAMLDHPNLIKTYEYYIDQESYHIISEYMEGGKLQDKLEKIQFFNEKNASIIMLQLLSSLSYLHDKKLLFKHLTCSSIYFESSKEGNYNIKLLYLGHSLYSAKNSKLRDIKSDPVYLAPETHKKIYNEKSDVWSLGVILYMLLCGYPPFEGKDRTDTLEKIVLGKYSMDAHEWDAITDNAKDLVKNTLTYDFKKRSSAKECLKHNWLTKIKKNEQKEYPKLKINNLSIFQSMKSFHKAVIEYLIHQHSTDINYNNLKKIFKDLDVDANGYLSYEDMKKAWKNCYTDDTCCGIEFDNFFNLADLKGNKRIEYEEFLRLTVNYEDLLSEKNLLKAFKFFDKNNTGVININDIKNSFVGHGTQDNEELAKQLMRELDIKTTDEISFEDFKSIVNELKKDKTLMHSLVENNI